MSKSSDDQARAVAAYASASRIRYAITQLGPGDDDDRGRTLTGLHLRETREEAEEYLRGVLANDSRESLLQIFPRLDTFRIDPVRCYDHGDPIEIVAAVP